MSGPPREHIGALVVVCPESRRGSFHSPRIVSKRRCERYNLSWPRASRRDAAASRGPRRALPGAAHDRRLHLQFQSALRQQMLGSLLGVELVTDGRNAIFSGPTGTGKTQLVIADRVSRAAAWLGGALHRGGRADRRTLARGQSRHPRRRARALPAAARRSARRDLRMRPMPRTCSIAPSTNAICASGPSS